jgi:hypothetical protein
MSVTASPIHVITVTIEKAAVHGYGVRCLVTCSEGCSFGTSAVQSTVGGAHDRAALHAHAVRSAPRYLGCTVRVETVDLTRSAV